MSRLLAPILIAVVGGLVLLSQILFIVPQTQHALVLQFGNVATAPISIPGLYVKVPFIQNVVYLDRRNLGFQIDNQSVIASDRERLVVDAMVRWQIVDPLLFYQNFPAGEAAGQGRLDLITRSEIRAAMGAVPRQDIVAGRRAELMRTITESTNRQVAAANIGVTVIDVRIGQADLPAEIQDGVFRRMTSDREQESARIRAEGQQRAAEIRAGADREAAQIRGEGEAKRAQIFAQSFGQDPEFASFYRSMQAYEQSIKEGTPLILAPESEFFRYLRDPRGRR